MLVSYQKLAWWARGMAVIHGTGAEQGTGKRPEGMEPDRGLSMHPEDLYSGRQLWCMQQRMMGPYFWLMFY